MCGRRAQEVDGEMVVKQWCRRAMILSAWEVQEKLAQQLEKRPAWTRVTVLGHLQRGGAPIPYDVSSLPDMVWLL